ncbi:hypothetical protein [Jannaschia marina]|uniref:hypothetical protein n=1 Tax=Jannaschia marina TaxID=2741674 RepID=UPI0015CDECCA|nr:hypothetical protein [Jannaschia marina]
MRSLIVAALVFAAPATAEETLRFFPPAGFTGVHVSDSGAVRLTDYVGEGQALDGWTDAITVAELRGTGLDAPGFVAGLSADLLARCARAFDMDPEVFEAGGRRSTMSIHACPNHDVSGRPEISLLRVIEGDDVLFAVQRSWVVSPPREDLLEWSEWIRALQVCDGQTCG